MKRKPFSGMLLWLLCTAAAGMVLSILPALQAQNSAEIAEAARAEGYPVTAEQVEQYTESEAEPMNEQQEEASGDDQQIDEQTEEPAAEQTQSVEAQGPSSIEMLLAGKRSGTVSRNLTQFGYNVFSEATGRFDPVRDVPVGQDYVVGPGDSFTVTMWGRHNDRITVVVDRDGKIALPEVGALTVSGMTFSELQDYLEAELQRKFTDFRMHITMRRLRTITVYVTGEAVVPGSHTLSALATVIHAVFAAGGPTKNGSLRNVRLLRAGRDPNSIDLYDFLMGGEQRPDMRLLDGDTIHIPLIGPVVGIAGNVKRPAIYEMKDPLTLEQALALAGGVNFSGWLQRVQIERVENHRRRIVADFDLSAELATSPQPLATVINDGDLIKVFPVLGTEQNVVYLEGHVVRPGKYELKPGMTLSDILDSYNLFLPQVNLEHAEIERLVPPDLHPIIIPFNLGKLLDGDRSQDYRLTPYDRIRLFRWDEKGKRSVTVQGMVYNPDEYRFVPSMRVNDLIDAAGGLRKDAYLNRAELLRRRTDPNGVAYRWRFSIDLGKAMMGDDKHNIELRDGDQLTVLSIPELGFDDQHVSVGGLVHEPNEYRLFEGMRVGDLLDLAGGLQKNAYVEKAELTRRHITQSGMVTESIELDLEQALAGDPNHNIPLQDYDYLVVRPISELEFDQSVTISGEVKFPGAYPIYKGERLSSLIERAGGYTLEAYLNGAVFTRESAKEVQRRRMNELIRDLEESLLASSSQSVSGALDQEAVAIQQAQRETKQALLDKLQSLEVDGRVVVKLDQISTFEEAKYNLTLEDGDTLHIPKTPGIVNVIGEIYNPTALVYEENQTVEYYLSRVGGMTKDADGKYVSVIRADGSVVSRAQKGNKRIAWNDETHQWQFGGFMTIELNPGDTIVVPTKLDKLAVLRTTKDLTQTIFQIAVAAGVVLAL